MDEAAVKRGGELFRKGLYCAESVLLLISEEKGIYSEYIPKIATGFCSGVARTSGMCGAVSGAIMGISLMTGRNTPCDPIEENYQAVRKFLEQFGNEFGTINCMELIGCDLSTSKGRAEFDGKNLEEKCAGLVEAATRFALQVLENK